MPKFPGTEKAANEDIVFSLIKYYGEIVIRFYLYLKLWQSCTSI